LAAKRQLTERKAALIFEAFEHDGLSPKSMDEIKNRIPMTVKHLRVYRSALLVVRDNNIAGKLSDEQWKMVKYTKHRTDSVTRAMLGRVGEWYARWVTSRSSIRRITELLPPTLHVEALLKARDRLAEQVLAIPDPEEQLLRDRKSDLLAVVGGRDGWLPWWQLPPGDITGEPAFKWLHEHMSDDPHWDALKLQASSGGTAESEWWSEYGQYRSNLQSIVRQVLEASRNAVDEACVALGSSSAPMLFPSFAVTAVRDALRVHLGRTPLMTPNYEMPSTSDPEGRTSFTVYCMGEKLAMGVADGVEMRSQMAAFITDTYKALRKRLTTSPDVRGIAERWHGLFARAREFAAWLKSLGVEDFERTTCSFCRPGDR